MLPFLLVYSGDVDQISRVLKGLAGLMSNSNLALGWVQIARLKSTG